MSADGIVDAYAEAERLNGEVEAMTARAEAAEATVEVLRAALNVALNDDDPEALEGARMALQEVRPDDLMLLAERDRLAGQVETLRARLAAVEALAAEWEQGTTAHEQAYQRANARRMPDKPEAGLNHLGAAHAMALCAARLRAALEVTPDA